MNDKVCKYIRPYYEVFVKILLQDQAFEKFHANEYARVQNARNKSLLRQQASAYSLLKVDSEHWVDHDKNGVPMLMKNNTAEIFSISFSHKESAVAAAIVKAGNKAIGVDLEVLSTGKDFSFLCDKIISIEEQFFLDQIRLRYDLSKKDAPLFFWVLKEAAFKAMHGRFEIFDFEVKLVENEIILTCNYAKNIFVCEVFIFENSIVAVVTMDVI